jgi:hypothetical protein
MLNARAQQRLVVADRVDGQLTLHDEIVQLKRSEVGQRIGLGIAPDQLDGVELGRVRRQQIGTHIAQITVMGTRNARRNCFRNAKTASPS